MVTTQLPCLGQTPSSSGDLGANAGHVQTNSVEPAAGAEVQGLAVLVPPGEVVRVLGANDRSEMLSFGREDPQAAGTRDVKVSLLVDLDPVDGVFARRRGHVEEERALAHA